MTLFLTMSFSALWVLNLRLWPHEGDWTESKPDKAWLHAARKNRMESHAAVFRPALFCPAMPLLPAAVSCSSARQ